MTPTKITIVAEDGLVCNGIRSMLSVEPTMRVVGEFSRIADMPGATQRMGPDLFVVDSSALPVTRDYHVSSVWSALQAAHRPFVVLGADDAPVNVELIRLGACVITRSRTSANDLIATVRLVAAGYVPVERRLAQRLAHGAIQVTANETVLTRSLTPREREVFRLVARGMSNAEIAESLTLAHSTVKSHVRDILRRLGLRNRLEMVIFAYRRPPPGRHLPAAATP